MNKNVIITGAAKRIGAHIAVMLAKQGYNIAIFYKNSEDSAKKICSLIQDIGVKCNIYKVNLSQSKELKKCYEKVLEDFGSISTLINNAAFFKNDTILNLTDENFDKHMNVNLKAPLLLSKLFFDNLNNKKGNIINICDYCIENVPSNFLSYTLSKSSLAQLTQILAVQLAPKVRVNAIAPGNVLKADFETKDHFKKSVESSLLKIPSSIEDILCSIDFLLKCKTITGQTLFVDSGKSLSNKVVY